MVFEKVEALFTNTFDLCRNAVNQDSTAKAERAVAFHRKLIEQDIIQLTSDLQDKLVLCEEMLHAGTFALFLSRVFTPSLIIFPTPQLKPITLSRKVGTRPRDPLARRGTRDGHASRLFPKPGSGTGSAVTQGVGCVTPTQGGDPPDRSTRTISLPPFTSMCTMCS
jgi:hypothetical protein